MVKIGYLSISVFATPPGRHLIGQRRSPPDDDQISAVDPIFGYSTPKSYPTTIPHYPKMARLFDHIGSTAHYAPSEFRPSASLCLLPTKTHRNHLRDVHNLVLPATNHRVLSPSVQPRPKVTSAQRSLLPTKSHLSTAAVLKDRS